MALLAAAIWPYPSERLSHDPGTTWRILDRDGGVLREAVGPWRVAARWAPLEEISPRVVQGLVSVEDRRFYMHPGVDFASVSRAIAQRLWYGRSVSGASTLTMQLARLLGGFERDGDGKLRQAIDALRIERIADKDEILEQYLNRAMFAPGTQGIEAACERTFGLPSRELTLGQAALMAGLAQAPVGHYPTRNPRRAMRRRQAVLDAMRSTGSITHAEHDAASKEPIVVVDGRPEPVALHFTDHVLALYPEPGVLQTTLSGDLARELQRRVAQYAALPEGAGVERAAVVVLDSATCDVLSMVGSLSPQGEFDRRTNWATTPMPSGLRVPGSPSAVDPLLNVLLAEHPEVPRSAPIRGAILDELRAAGLQTLDWEGPGPLGEPLLDGEVTLLDLAAALAVLSRGGEGCVPRVLLGEELEEGPPILSASAAQAAREALPEVGDGMALTHAAVSDGGWTSAWAAGLGEGYTVAVWVSGPEVAPLSRDPIDAVSLLSAVLPAIPSEGP